MNITDPISDMLTRIRNAISANHENVKIPSSKLKISIANILLKEGYIKNFHIINNKTQNIIDIILKYNKKLSAITGLKRISKPGYRVYTSSKKTPRVLRGLGTAIISTSKGIMNDKSARYLNVGGEVLAFIW